MKLTRLNLYVSVLAVLLVLVLFSVDSFGKMQKPDKNSGTYVSNRIAFPILTELAAKAKHIYHVKIIKKDGGSVGEFGISEWTFTCKILQVYKGNLNRNDNVHYHYRMRYGKSCEEKLKGKLNREYIIFLRPASESPYSIGVETDKEGRATRTVPDYLLVDHWLGVIPFEECLSSDLTHSGCHRIKGHQRWTFHTTPDHWEKARVFQTPISYSSYPWDEKITVKKLDEVDSGNAEKHFSPNEAYWYSKRFSDNGTFEVIIFNERQYNIIDTGCDDHYLNQVKWVNEKILYIRDWCGQKVGIDILFDVEKEETLYMEECHDGGLAFVQWQQNKNKQENRR